MQGPGWRKKYSVCARETNRYAIDAAGNVHPHSPEDFSAAAVLTRVGLHLSAPTRAAAVLALPRVSRVWPSLGNQTIAITTRFSDAAGFKSRLPACTRSCGLAARSL
ncbi:hypothetical protein COEREDRAFT_10351 [Coemansia reversa NRRL 1564]|uniref:Uncharacterized protein n=1 Tax=Coemansia reversa (strain ATCC 12441 / NRRL 1564) TaxID=763665 RepID=A0A2G5B622_COERN|nr:hypothetical protein COEREDRAFT_10351 [Coemansia reversa NRRL 1564]|eukprot:PIA14458.1 hypothetical protein COEREDRAFT_10351 [Coemansia reversa NRRL 1564]